MTKSTTNGRSQKPNAKNNVTSIGAARKPKSVGAEATAPAINQSAEGEPALIVFGLDDSGKAHASRFTEADAELAIKAAGMMEFKVLHVTSPDIRAQALALPTGRVFSSGRAFTPFTKTAVYEALSGFDGVFQPPMPPEAQPAPAPVATGTPQQWDHIGIGSLVLATTETPADGWFESIVVEDRSEGLYVLRWRDWPEDEPFVRRADGLALLPVQKTEVPAPSQSST